MTDPVQYLESLTVLKIQQFIKYLSQIVIKNGLIKAMSGLAVL